MPEQSNLALTSKEKSAIITDFNNQLDVANRARSPYLEVVKKSRKQYAGIMEQRTNSRGTKLTTVNINRTKTAVRVAVRSAIKAFLRGDTPLRVKPLGPDDVDTAEVLDQYMIQSFSHIPGIEELMYKHLMQSYTNGTGPNKLRYDKYRNQIYFDWILFENCWFDNAPAFALIKYIFERVPMTKATLDFLGDKGEYDAKMVKEFLKGNKDKGKDVRSEAMSDVNKPLPEEQGKEFYDVLLHWYEKETDKGIEWWFATIGCSGGDGSKYEGQYVLGKPKKAPGWYGHPYTAGISHFNPLGVYGIGLPEDIRDLQSVRNLIFQQQIDVVNKNLNVPTTFEQGTFLTAKDAENFLNWELGKMCQVKPGGNNAIKQFPSSSLSPDSFASTAEIDREIERQVEFPGVLSGEQPSRREPGVTTKARMSLAGEGIEANIWTMAISFYKPFLEKFLLCKQQYYDEDEFIRITGKQGERWLKMGNPRFTPNDPILEGDTFRFGATKEDAVKIYDIELVPSYEMESKDMLKQHIFETIGALTNLGQLFPYVIQNSDGSEIMRQFLKSVGFPNTHKIFTSPDMLPPEALSILAKLFKETPQEFMKAILKIPVMIQQEQVTQQGSGGTAPPAKSPADVPQRPSTEINAMSDQSRREATQM